MSKALSVVAVILAAIAMSQTSFFGRGGPGSEPDPPEAEGLYGPPDPPQPWHTGFERPVFSRATLDSLGAKGSYTSVTTGIDGYGLISYHEDAPNYDLRVAHCSDVACTMATPTTIDSSGIQGWYTSITIGADGFGLISYYEQTNANLRVAHCTNVPCTTSTFGILDGGQVGVNLGQYTSITIGVDGLGLISYYDQQLGRLKVAHCSDVACTAATITPFDSGSAGLYTSITIGVDGFGLISYYDEGNSRLKVAHCSNVLCTAATITPLDSTDVVGLYTSITIGVDGFGLISYYEQTTGNLKVAHCLNVACTSAAWGGLDGSVADVGSYTSITIGGDGLGLISYYDITNTDLKVAHCSNVQCTASSLIVVDAVGSVGGWTSATIGLDGFCLISYIDWANVDLKAVHCSDLFGTPYVRRR